MDPIQQKISQVLNIQNLSPEEQEEILLRSGALIYQEILMRAMESMSSSDQAKFEKILDNSAAPEEIFDFLKEKVKDFEKIIIEEAEKFRTRSSGIMSQIGE